MAKKQTNETQDKIIRHGTQIKKLCKERGIETAGALWRHGNGLFSSKETTANLFEDKVTMIKLETIDALCCVLRCTPKDLFIEIE